ncbi:MAG: flagellar motor switch protein FliM [Bryobacteraceae bacterium]
MNQTVSHGEVDGAFGASSDAQAVAHDVQAFDIRKLDKIPKSQLRSLHLVHETFTRNLTSNLSAYLRSYVMLNLVSLEQISYGEFVEGLASPACLAYISLHPYDGTAILDINPSLAFRLVEILLGSKEQSFISVQRKITEIEKRLVRTILGVILRELQDAWKSVADVNFEVSTLASETQLNYAQGSAEAMIVIAIEMRVGGASGLMNLALPALFIKRLRNKFDQLEQIRRAEATPNDQLHMGTLLQHAEVDFNVQVAGGTVKAETLLDLCIGDVLILGESCNAPFRGLLNGRPQWLGSILEESGKLAFEITGPVS